MSSKFDEKLLVEWTAAMDAATPQYRAAIIIMILFASSQTEAGRDLIALCLLPEQRAKLTELMNDTVYKRLPGEAEDTWLLRVFETFKRFAGTLPDSSDELVQDVLMVARCYDSHIAKYLP